MDDIAVRLRNFDCISMNGCGKGLQKEAADEIERLRASLAIVASVLLGEQTRSGGKPFSGQWNIITHDWRGTVDDAIILADTTLQKDHPHASN